MTNIKFSKIFVENIIDEVAAIIALELKRRDSVSIDTLPTMPDSDSALAYVKLTKAIDNLSLSAPTMENFSVDATIHLTIGEFEGDFKIKYPQA